VWTDVHLKVIGEAMVKTIARIATQSLVIGAIGAGVVASHEGAPDHTVTQAQFDRWKTELSNWGRWGKEDQKGTLNLITPAKRKQAAALVKDGVAISLARNADTSKSIDNANPYESIMRPVGPSSSGDRISVSFHGYAHTHLDALGHHFIDGKLYNGFSRDEYVTQEKGAQKGAIINAKDGIFTRGVLVDIPRMKGVPYLEPGKVRQCQDIRRRCRVHSNGAVAAKSQARSLERRRTGGWPRRLRAAVDQEARYCDSWQRIGAECQADTSQQPDYEP
jgi:hypothetical protein